MTGAAMRNLLEKKVAFAGNPTKQFKLTVQFDRFRQIDRRGKDGQAVKNCQWGGRVRFGLQIKRTASLTEWKYQYRPSSKSSDSNPSRSGTSLTSFSSLRSSSIGSRPTTVKLEPHSSQATPSPCSHSASTKTSSLHSGQIDVGISANSPRPLLLSVFYSVGWLNMYPINNLT